MFPIQKVVLHKNGLAYFERAGVVTGTQTVTLDFSATEMDDVLRSLRVVDEGGRVESITYDSAGFINSAGRPPVFIPFDNSIGAALYAMQGVNVRLIDVEDASITGRIMGVTTQTIPEKAPCQMIDVLAANQLISWRKDNIKSITILDESLPASLSAFLDYAATKRDRQTRKVTVKFSGDAKRTVYFCYVIKHAVWKSSYRLNMKAISGSTKSSNNNNTPSGIDTHECLLEGWACVDNVSDSSWSDVKLTLASGTPLSYSYDIYNTIYGTRPSEFTLGYDQKYEQEKALPQLNFAAAQNAPQAFAAQPAANNGNAPQAFGVQPQNNPPNAHAHNPPAFGQAATQGFGAPAAQETQLAFDFTENNDAFHSSTVAGQHVARVEASHFAYEIQKNVSVAVNQAVLVPTVQGQIKGRKVCWYSDKVQQPFLSVLFKNTLGVVLDKGPVTVLLNDTYAGESLIDTFVSERDEKVVPYSAYLQVRVHKAPPKQDWIPQKVEISKGRISGVQRLQQTIAYHIQNTTDAPLDFVLDHIVPRGWELVAPKVDQTVQLDKTTARFFFKLPPLKTTILKVKHNKENRTADVWILNMNTFTLEQLENLLTPEIGNKIVGFFETAKEIYLLRSTYISLKQQEDSILSEEYRIHTILNASYTDEHIRSNLAVKLTEYEDRLVRTRESLAPTLDEWSSKRSALLDSIESMEAVVNFADKDKLPERFKVPPLLPTMNIRQLLAEYSGAFAHDPVFRPGPFGHDPFADFGEQGGQGGLFGGFGAQGQGGFGGQGQRGFGTQGQGGFGAQGQGGFGAQKGFGTQGGFGAQRAQGGFGAAPRANSFGAQAAPSFGTAGVPPPSDTNVTWRAQPASAGQTVPPPATSSFGAAFSSAATSSAPAPPVQTTPAPPVQTTPAPSTTFSFGSASSAPGTSSGTSAAAPAFGTSATTATTTPAFGTPASTTTTTPAFGTPAFGPPGIVTFGTSGTPAFGAPATVPGIATFGTSGTPTYGTTSFGAAPATTATSSLFTTGTSHPSSSTTEPTSISTFSFGATARPEPKTAPAFGGAPSHSTVSSTFGAASTPNTATSLFGPAPRPPLFGAAPPTSTLSLFGAPAPSSNTPLFSGPATFATSVPPHAPLFSSFGSPPPSPHD